MPEMSDQEFDALRERNKAAIQTPADCNPWQANEFGEPDFLPRSMVVLRPREPYVQWAKTVEPDYSLDKARRDDVLALMIPMQYGTAENSEEFIEANWQSFFGQMLAQIEPDRKRWPRQLSFAMMHEWFDVELCQAIIDIAGDDDEDEFEDD